ncbi:MAG: LptA/OstA family protein [Roseimicrobium sp.]
MTPSGYFVAIPLSIIAVATLMSKWESDSFTLRERTSGIQQIPQHALGRVASPPHSITSRASSVEQRYATGEDEQWTALGEDVPERPLGRAPTDAPGWLAKRETTLTKQRFPALPEILGFTAVPRLADPAESIPTDAGFHITADEATNLDVGRQTVTFQGRVTLSSPQFHLTAAKLVVHLGKDQSFRIMEASGNVDVQLTGVPEEKRYRGQAGKAIYDPRKGTLLMEDWPKIQGAGRELVAANDQTRIVLYPKTGQMRTQGRAQTRVAQRVMESAQDLDPAQSPE